MKHADVVESLLNVIGKPRPLRISPDEITYKQKINLFEADVRNLQRHAAIPLHGVRKTTVESIASESVPVIQHDQCVITILRSVNLRSELIPEEGLRSSLR